MSRTSLLTIAGLVAFGSLVALVPAQESARRTASQYREAAPPAPAVQGQPPALIPLPGSAGWPQTTRPVGAGGARGPVSGQSPYTAGESAQPAASAPATADAPAPEQGPSDAASEGGLKSVLKRGRPPMIYESPAPPPTANSIPRNELQPPPTEAPSRPAAPSATSRPRSNTAAQAHAAARAAKDLSAVAKSPALKVEVTGPQGVTVGKPAEYMITVTNEGEAAAEEVQLRVLLPTWVAVQATQLTSGEAGLQGDAPGLGRISWLVPNIAGRSREQLKLQLVTREADAFDVGVEWVARPGALKASVLVKKPQLELSLTGPADMTFGEEKAFTLTVSNPGTGDAEQVVVSVAAAGAPPQQFDAGTIPAGHKKEVPLAVVASQPGTIDIAISATGETGLEARTSGKVTVRKAEIQVALDGPPLKYAGSDATYVLTVANHGSAAADNIQMSLALPPGAKYLGGIDGAAAAGDHLKWKIGSMGPGGERMYEVRVQLNTAGQSKLTAQSQAAASGIATCEAQTEVEAVCDLKLVLNDPAGPVPVGDSAIYELQLMNRGTQAARQVKIVMQFADGVEPTAFEGCEARIVPGQVLCQPLTQLAPGEQVTLRIKAKAEEAGSRMFRVEVTSTDGDVRLVSEGTTRFFVDTDRGGAAATTARRPSLLPNPPVPAYR